MARVLSFDIGTKNLSLCDLSVKASGDFEVTGWSVVSTVPPGLNVNKTPVWDLAPPFYNYLQEHAKSWLFEASGPKKIDRVLIENQPMGGRGTARNLKTKVLSHILQCVILHLRPDLTVAFVHPGLKLKDMPRPEDRKSSYRENKAYAVESTATLIASEKCLSKDYCTEAYAAIKKKDDLADAFLQGYFVAQIMARGDMIIPSVEVPTIVPLADTKKPKSAKASSKASVKATVKSVKDGSEDKKPAKKKKASAIAASEDITEQATVVPVVAPAVDPIVAPAVAAPVDVELSEAPAKKSTKRARVTKAEA